ncbi:MAG TPA: hypothetical protein VJZ49_15325 [Syntrophales bacterium]|nr:hypothetical protein [Syntrophales bacterium]
MDKSRKYDDIIAKGTTANSEHVKLQNIVHMGLGFSAMMRLLEEKQKGPLHEKLVEVLPCFFVVKDNESFEKTHSDCCVWGTKNIWLAKNKRHNKPRRLISYGQIAKTLNVVLKVAVHYAQLPNPDKANLIQPWLHAAVDNEMMKMLKSEYKSKLNPWPESIEKVCGNQYFQIQAFVQDFIAQYHAQKLITAVDFDDIYWNLLNKKPNKKPEDADDKE